MTKLERIKAVLLYGVFIGYLLVLLKILFLSRVSVSELFNTQRAAVRSINLVPFDTIREYLSGSSANLRRFASANVVGNILIFIPLGVYLTALKRNKNVLANLCLILALSLLVEIIQGLLGIGTADIDDVILNGLGGWIGILAYQFLRIIVRGQKNALTAVTVLSVVMGLPVICYYLFFIKMRF
ncbi:VanZ family protein [Paenibacillus glycinis]|uniref:VanZ family protein n=1 Tax=Paenibacillus glycinis TaxID=2697035 RepID=A0ABW9XX22_9BACL|nr:VanZ family protein [Paenibacillus glycinis]NBD27257.1 VanZ family protein [Paenibacillus glycinis]